MKQGRLVAFLALAAAPPLIAQVKEGRRLEACREGPKDLLLKPGHLVPPEATDFVDALNQLSPRNASGW